MKITEQQLLALFMIAKDSLKMTDNTGRIFSYDDKARCNIVNKIISQQSDKLIEIDDK